LGEVGERYDRLCEVGEDGQGLVRFKEVGYIIFSWGLVEVE
jgi:hypothetical protein